jgi:Kef-type K+ transport system membrane component KefB
VSAHKEGTGTTRWVQALALVVVFGFSLIASRMNPAGSGVASAVAAVGFLLLAGTLLSELLEVLGLPHLSAYLLVGILGGPHVLHLVDHATVERLSPVNTLALALIALAGGAELRIATLRAVARSVSVALFFQCIPGLLVMTVAFYALSHWTPLSDALSSQGLLGVAILWGVLAVSRSPSACLGILSQTRAKGPVASFSLAFIMSSDVVVVVLMAASLMLVRPLITPGGTISFSDFNVLGHELLGSVSMGTTLGLLLSIYIKLAGHNLLLVLLALGFGMTEFMRYVHIDPLLSFLTAGFVVQNLSAQGEKLLHSVEGVSSIVFVVFFATAGAHLDLPLLKQLWPIALALCVCRGVTTFTLSKVSTRFASDKPALKQWSWAGLVSQAGLTLGLNVVITRTFPQLGSSFGSLVVATVAINEMVGPVLFKLSLDRTGESDAGGGPGRPSLPEMGLAGDSHA